MLLTMRAIFTEARRLTLRESAGDPFVGLSPELQDALRRFSEHLAFWMGNTSEYSVKELGKVWKGSPELRAWLSKHVNLASYTLYYGARLKAGQHVEVGDTWKGPKGVQHWSTNPSTSRWFAGIGTINKPSWPGGVLVEAHATKAQIIVDVDRFSHVCGQHHASFVKLMTKSDPKEMFNGEAFEAEVMKTSAVKGKVIEIRRFEL